MRIFITGGTGFIGSYTVQQIIKNGHSVLVLTRNPDNIRLIFKQQNKIKILQGDMAKITKLKNEIKQFSPEIALHMAWEGIPNYDQHISTKNLTNGLEVIRIVAQLECNRIICTGSCWEYEKSQGQLSENIKISPTKPFTIAKNTLHNKGKQIARDYNMDFIWTRFFYVYGPRQNTHSLIPSIIHSIQSGKRPEIKTPYSKNDFIYVEDVADALTRLIQEGKNGKIYNIGSGYSTEITQIINLVYQQINSNERYKPTGKKPNEKDIIDFWADITEIHNDLEWVPKTSIEEGVKKTVEYCQQQLLQNEILV